MPRELDDLTRINLDDLVSSFGWEKARLGAGALRRAFRGSARRFAEQMAELDDAVALHGNLCDAARLILRKFYIRGLQVEGLEHLPQGPVLFLSNHPGFVDAISLFAAIGRPDLKAVALRRPFLDALPAIAQHLVFLDENLGRRVIAAHDIAAYLRGGGAVVTFPAGRIEPDPDLHADAVRSLADWKDSASCIARLAPEAHIVPVLVRGVIWDKAQSHFLTRLKQTRADREKLGAALQLLAMVSGDLRPTAVQVRFAPPLRAGEGDLHRRVADRMRQMIVDGSPPRAAIPAGWWPQRRAPAPFSAIARP